MKKDMKPDIWISFFHLKPNPISWHLILNLKFDSNQWELFFYGSFSFSWGISPGVYISPSRDIYCLLRGIYFPLQGYILPPPGVYIASSRGIYCLLQGYIFLPPGVYIFPLQGFIFPRSGVYISSSRGSNFPSICTSKYLPSGVKITC